ncbi:sel1 repeat family protein [Photobacterium leiognathi]|uniref:tetratricopeptide repeat protein n=1 Tax=Photobacterium leiognathi TaxID=553611 RepID=UPI001EDEC99A|nr:hypothetical protein [Photobacterium leiognathi]MCG3884478.1 sel1 repeat family protein [Photobacterium leiognathi]
MIIKSSIDYMFESQFSGLHHKYKLGFEYSESEFPKKNAQYYFNHIGALSQKNCDAAYVLARCYYLGNVVDADVVKSIYLYNKAAELGSSAAKNFLKNSGIPSLADYPECLHEQIIRASNGNSKSMHSLGVAYMNGVHEGHVVPKSIPDAISWLEKSCLAGSSEAIQDLIEILICQTSKKDSLLRWLKWGADQNDYFCLNLLADSYRTGFCTEKNIELCKQYMIAAINVGRKEMDVLDTVIRLVVLYSNDSDWANVEHWSLVAISDGCKDHRVYSSLGKLYFSVPNKKDYKKAQSFLEQAIQYGSLCSFYTLANLHVASGNQQKALDNFELAHKHLEHLHSQEAVMITKLHLAQLYCSHGTNEQKEYVHDLLKPLCDQNNPSALHTMALYYLNKDSFGVRDGRFAVYWSEKAANAGVGNAMFNMALFHADKRHSAYCETCYTFAEKWAQKAVEAGVDGADKVLLFAKNEKRKKQELHNNSASGNSSKDKKISKFGEEVADAGVDSLLDFIF